jgi:cellulose biosynthesis protein BcsQ
MGIGRTLVFAQGKGGVGKTTLAANVSALAAAAGHHVLLVDLDQQGNIARDLGFQPDSGDELLHALIAATTPLPIVRNVRSNLDVVPGGPAVGDAAVLFTSREQRGGATLADALAAKLTAVVDDYDLIVIDTPPGDRVIVEAALTVATSVVIPTRMDEASIDGVTRIAERFIAVRDRNPDLTLAGVVLFAISSRTTRLERDVRAALERTLGGAAPVFDTRIRHLDSAAADARRRGLLVHELEQAASADRNARLQALRSGSTPAGNLYARDASGLAGDYEQLTAEILTRIVQLEQEYAAS